MIASRHIQFLVVFLGCLLAIYVGSNIVALPVPALMVILAVISVIIWMLIAGENWWAFFLGISSVGGTFYVGFKVYPYEIALVLCVVGLVPLVLVQDRKIFQNQRKPLPAIFYITALYLTGRLMIDVLIAHDGRGSLLRLLLAYTWPFAFALLFHHYASFSALRLAIGTMFSLLLLRTLFALVGFFTGWALIVPGVNYILSLSADDSLISMRTVAFGLMSTTTIVFNACKSSVARAALLVVFAFGSILVVMGAGRFQTLVMLTLPIAFFAWSRKWALLTCAAVGGFGLIACINFVPQTLDLLPTSAGRALSGLVFTTNYSQTDFGTTSSDAWHDQLRQEGLRRLTASPRSFLFGDGITFSADLYTEMKSSIDPKVILGNAANMGAYENGLWAVLAVVGSVGFMLYLLLFIRLWRDTLPYFFRKPRGTLWEGMLFVGCYSSACWYLVSYFEGGPPSAEILMMIMAWNLVQDGKLDEAIPAKTLPNYSAPTPFAKGLPVYARG